MVVEVEVEKKVEAVRSSSSSRIVSSSKRSSENRSGNGSIEGVVNSSEV